MMMTVLLIIALGVSVCSAALPEVRVIWIAHGGGWVDRYTTVNSQHFSELPANLLIFYTRRGYTITHHSMGVSEQYPYYSWVLEKRE